MGTRPYPGNMVFQSTPPRRRATRRRRFNCQFLIAVSIHAPPEEGDSRRRAALRRIDVSIHAPPEEGDIGGALEVLGSLPFQSTPPRRRATRPENLRFG